MPVKGGRERQQGGQRQLHRMPGDRGFFLHDVLVKTERDAAILGATVVLLDVLEEFPDRLLMFRFLEDSALGGLLDKVLARLLAGNTCQTSGSFEELLAAGAAPQ